jgi:hypothetical protein
MNDEWGKGQSSHKGGRPVSIEIELTAQFSIMIKNIDDRDDAVAKMTVLSGVSENMIAGALAKAFNGKTPYTRRGLATVKPLFARVDEVTARLSDDDEAELAADEKIEEERNTIPIGSSGE